MTVVVGYAAASAAHVALIRRQPDRWGGPDAGRATFVSAVGVLFSCFVIVWSGWESILWGTVLLAGGLPLYRWSVKRAPLPAEAS